MITSSWTLNGNLLRLLECWEMPLVTGGFSTDVNQPGEYDVWK